MADPHNNKLPICITTGLVRLNILEKDWTAVLSLELIIFALENMLKFPEQHQFQENSCSNSGHMKTNYQELQYRYHEQLREIQRKQERDKVMQSLSSMTIDGGNSSKPSEGTKNGIQTTVNISKKRNYFQAFESENV